MADERMDAPVIVIKGDTSDINKKLDDSAKKIDDLGSKADKATSKFSQLGARLSAAMGNIGSGVKNVWHDLTAHAGEFSDKAEKLRTTIKSLEDAMSKLAKQEFHSEAYNEANEAVKKLNESLGKMYERRDKMSATGVSENSQAWKSLAYDIQAAEEELARWERRLRDVGETGQAWVSGADTSEYAEMAAKLADLKAELASVSSEGNSIIGNAVRSVGSTLLSAVRTAAKETWSKLGSAIKKCVSAAGDLVKRFFSLRREMTSVKDIARSVYRTFTSMFRMLQTRLKRKLISAIFKDATEAFNQIVQMSPRLNAAISGFLASAKALGAQVVAAFEPLISTLLPVVTQLLDYLTRGANYLAQFISALTGNETFIEASKGQVDYAASLDKTADSTAKATKATKAYKAEVLSFDQLHKLGGSDTSDPLGMQGVDLNEAENKVNKLTELGKKLKEAWDDRDFKRIGQIAGEAVNDAFGWLKENFGWTANADKIKEALRGIIDTVNEFIATLNGKTIGEALGDVGNVFVHILEEWTNPDGGFDFTTFGTRIGEILGNFVATIDWEDLGTGIMNGIQGVVKTVNGFLSATVEDEKGKAQSIFSVLGHGLSDLLTGMISAFTPEDWSDLLSGLINGFFEFIATAFSDPQKANELGKKLGETLSQTIKKLDGEKIAEGLNALSGAFNEAVGGALSEFDVGGALSKAGEIIDNLQFGSIAITASILMAPSVISSLTSAFSTMLIQLGFSQPWFTALLTLAAVFVYKNRDFLKDVGGAVADLAEGTFETIKAWVTGEELPKTTQTDLGKKALETLAGTRDVHPPKVPFGISDTVRSFLQEGIDKVKSEMFNQVESQRITDAKASLLNQPESKRITNAKDNLFNGKDYEMVFVPNTMLSMTDAVRSALDASGWKAPSDVFTPQNQAAPWVVRGDSDGAASQGMLDMFKESVAMPTDSVAMQNTDTFTDAITTGMRETIWDAFTTFLADRDQDVQDIILRVDSEDLARATLRGENRINKRTNPLVSFA